MSETNDENKISYTVETTHGEVHAPTLEMLESSDKIWGLIKCTAEGCMARDWCLRCITPDKGHSQAYMSPPGHDERSCFAYLPYDHV